MGIRHLKQMNQALLGKWLWRIGYGTDGLWRQVLDRKYSPPRWGWDVQDATAKTSAICKGILSVKRLPMENIKYKIGSGESILFYKDQCTGDRSLGTQFPDLFNCAKDKEAKVKAYMARISNQVVWSPTLRRNLKDNEESQFISLLNLLNGMFILENGEGRKVLEFGLPQKMGPSLFLLSSRLSLTNQERGVR